MASKTLNIHLRKDLKTNASKRYRRNGKIPAVIYGHSKPEAIVVDANEFNKKFHKVSANTIISLLSQEKNFDVIVKDYQYDIIQGKITHIDFYEIAKDKTLHVRVPVYCTGTALGVREGGIMEQRMHEIEVDCLPKDIPEKIEVSVSDLKIGQSLHVHQLPAFEGVRYLTSGDQVVVVITHLREEKAAAPAEAAEGAAAGEGAAADTEGSASGDKSEKSKA